MHSAVFFAPSLTLIDEPVDGRVDEVVDLAVHVRTGHVVQRNLEAPTERSQGEGVAVSSCSERKAITGCVCGALHSR